MAPSSSKPKRMKRSSSGGGRKHPGDPPTDRIIENPGDLRIGDIIERLLVWGIVSYPCLGVRVRTVGEIKQWPDGLTAACKNFNYEVPVAEENNEWYGVITDIAMAKVVGMLVHDLARMYSDPNYPAEKLNIIAAEIWIRLERQNREFVNQESFIGQAELEKYVRGHPLKTERSKWKDLDKAGFDSLKMEIKVHSRKLYDVLMAAIIKDIWVAGRRMKDKAQILESVEQSEDSDPRDKEIQDLKERMSSLEVTLAAERRAKDAELKDAERRAQDAELRAKHANQRAQGRSFCGRCVAGTDILIPNILPYLNPEDSIVRHMPVLDADCVQVNIAMVDSLSGCERQGEAQILNSVQHGEESNPKE